jgi:hypothetical protein
MGYDCQKCEKSMGSSAKPECLLLFMVLSLVWFIALPSTIVLGSATNHFRVLLMLWPMGYGYKIPANQLKIYKNVWPIRVYGLYRVCVRRESTVGREGDT